MEEMAVHSYCSCSVSWTRFALVFANMQRTTSVCKARLMNLFHFCFIVRINIVFPLDICRIYPLSYVCYMYFCCFCRLHLVNAH